MPKRIITAIATLLLAGLSAMGARAPRYAFRHIGSEEGLSASCVKTICQDRFGFMWFGTKNGLNRYDGHSVTRFDCFDRTADRGNNNIGALYEAPDGKLWVGTDRGVYLYDFENDSFSFMTLKSQDGVSADDWVQEIIGDSEGNVWILVPDQGIFRCNGGKMTHYKVSAPDQGKSSIPSTVFATDEGLVFVGTNQNGLYRYNPRNDRFERMGDNGRGFPQLAGKNLNFIRQGVDGNLTLCTQDGELYHYDIAGQELNPLPFSKQGELFIRALMCVDNEIWIGTHHGLHIINLITGSERIITEQTDNPTSLSNSTVYCLYNDRDGNCWIGTMFGGVNYYQRYGFKFDIYQQTSLPSSLSSNRVRGIAADGPHIIVGTEESGYNVLDTRTGEITRHNNGKVTLIMRHYGNETVAGYARNGAERIVDGKVVSTMLDNLIEGIDESSVYSYMIDNHGNRWAGSDWGLYKAMAGSDSFQPVKEVGQAWIFDMAQDSRGIVWFASMGSGIYSYNPSNGKFRHYPYDEQHTNGLESNSISSVMEDSHGNIWFSTDRGGLARYDSEHDRFVTYGREAGLPDTVTYDILEDDNGYLWFGTNSGLVKFNPEGRVENCFTTSDGLPNNQFNYHSVAKGDDGYFYFGTLSGLVAFNPIADTERTELPALYFTRLIMAGQDVQVGVDGSPLTKSILFTEEIDLPADCPGFTLTMAAPGYATRGKYNYSYRMLPNDTAWIPVSEPELSFAKLAPGNYTLEVKISDGANETVKTLLLHIRTPWYMSWWAILIWGLLLAGAIVGWWWWYRRYKNRQLRESEKLFKVNKEKELYENKVAFFTELAHEIRTPLALIDGPLQALESLEVSDAAVNRYVKVMRLNTARLLNLTGQLLDFQKIGAQKFNISYEKVDVNTTLNDIIDRFEPAMVLKGKHLERSVPEQTVWAVTDREAFTKIMGNLLNNALKYSQQNIAVSLESDSEKMYIRVSSDGDRISDENRLRIFEPFFQVDSSADNNGVGIGLPLCRTLAHLQHGSIEVEGGQGIFTNTFVLTLPLRQKGVEEKVPEVAPTPMAELIMNEDSGSNDSSETDDNGGCSILVVEDNEQMRDFLCEQLSHDFMVETAEDGAKALERMKEHNFDLVVTDIMMPVMDGYALCEAIKSDINRSHIPVVFLTAKNDVDSKVRALKCGGEAYIEKPFSIKYFRQQIKSLLENRRHERKAFLKQPFFSIDKMKLTDADKEFMDKVLANISQNIADENFSVESMADIFCMSRSSLLRKIKTLFNLSPIELIRIVRLKKAAELIQEGKYRIGDVCFMVGISSPSYFSKLFFKQFGVTPKEFDKQCKQNSRTTAATVAPTAAREGRSVKTAETTQPAS